MPKIIINLPTELHNWINEKCNTLLVDRTKLVVKMLLQFKKTDKTAHEE